MNNITSTHNNLFANPGFSGLKSAFQNYTEKRCSGRGCTKRARNLLEVLFINKKGYFCDECTDDLLANKLAISVQEGDQS